MQLLVYSRLADWTCVTD